MYLKKVSVPRVLIRFILCKFHIVKQYNVNICYLIMKKWFTENPKYFETKYDATLYYFVYNCFNYYMLYYL